MCSVYLFMFIFRVDVNVIACTTFIISLGSSEPPLSRDGVVVISCPRAKVWFGACQLVEKVA